MKRDDFAQATKTILAKRVGFLCSNPNCRKPTVGSNETPGKSTLIGVAAHITAALSRGPRYDDTITSEQRQHIDNGIWLCSNCATLIDKDFEKYTIDLLNQWKEQAELESSDQLKGARPNLNAVENTSADIIPLFTINRLEDRHSPSYAELMVSIKNISDVPAENALLILTIEYPENILNGGYHCGRNHFSKNKAQLYADLVYPGIVQSFKAVKVKEFNKMLITTTLVAKNMQMKSEKIFIRFEDGELKINQIFTNSPTWIEDLMGKK